MSNSTQVIETVRKNELESGYIRVTVSRGVGLGLDPLHIDNTSTIVISKLSSEPYHATFFYLAKLLEYYVVPAVVILGILGIFLVHESQEDTEASLAAEETEDRFPGSNRTSHLHRRSQLISRPACHVG